jgi:protein SCO1
MPASAVTLLAMLLIVSVPSPGKADTRHIVKGLVVDVDTAHARLVVSHDAIADLMPAMTMPFDVRPANNLAGIVAGMLVEFTLVVGKETSYAESIRILKYEPIDQDPLTAQRLTLLRDRARRTTVPLLDPGELVPDFTLTDHLRRRVSLSQFRGKVVALNFIYTSCALPQFCYRMSNHFNVVQRRFRTRSDLVLLTVTFDPARDDPEALAEYARQWNSNPDTWRFLTGSSDEVRAVTSRFGVEFFPDDGLLSHSLHTAVIDRRGRLVANLEGNQFTAAQLGDLVEHTLAQR